MTLAQGTTIDKYTLGRCIGAGGMGEVYEAHHTLVRKRCAIKLLHADMASQSDVVTRMLHEAQAAAAIGHPNIVDTMDFGSTADGTYYLVMEYLDGESLGDLIQRAGTLDAEATVRIAVQVLSALEAAHAKGIVHRDLKPDNIFIARGRRGEEEVKLLDFGISKFATDDTAERLTASGMVMGTPFYMSPEQAEGADKVDGRTDLWAMGVILYEALSGKMPFGGNSYNKVIIQVVTQEPAPLRSLCPEVSEALERVVSTALVKDSVARWSSAGAMMQALLEAVPQVAQEAATAGGPTPSLLDVARGPGGSTVPGGHVVGDPAQATDQNFVTGETAMLAPTPSPQPAPASPEAPEAPVGSPPEDAVPRTTPATGAVAGRQSVLWDPGARKRKVLIGGAILVGLAALGGILLYSLGGPAKEPPARSAAGDASSMQTSPAADAAVPGPTTATRPRVAAMGALTTLSVRLVGVPSRASVRVDGNVVSVPLTLPADGREHELEVRAPRYRTHRQKFRATSDLTSLTVSLRRRRGGEPTRRVVPARARPTPPPMRTVPTARRPPPRPMPPRTTAAMRPRPEPRRANPPPMRRGVFTSPFNN